MIGARGETRTLMLFRRRILNPLCLPFHHPGIADRNRILAENLNLCESISKKEKIFEKGSNMPRNKHGGTFV